MGGPENGNFPLLYVMKMSLHKGWVVQKSLKTPLRNIKMAPYKKIPQIEANEYIPEMNVNIEIHSFLSFLLHINYKYISTLNIILYISHFK